MNIILNNNKLNNILNDTPNKEDNNSSVTSLGDILEKCDEWIDVFKKTHDTFRDLVLTNKYKLQDISMVLSFEKDNRCRGNRIVLNLQKKGQVIQNGVSITVEQFNKDIYKYLTLNVLNHYISTNYSLDSIDLSNFNWFLKSNYNGTKNPIYANLGLLSIDSEFTSIVYDLISSQNIGTLKTSYKKLKDNLRNNIKDKSDLDEVLFEFPNHEKQYKYISQN